MGKLLLMCAVICLVANSCGRTEYKSVLDQAESLLNSSPDSAIVLLDACSGNKWNNTDKFNARHALLYSIALDKNYIDLASDSIIAPAVRYYENHGSVEDKLRTKYYLGRIRYNAGNYSNAIVHFEEAAELVTKTDNSLMTGLIYRSMMLCHAMIYNYPEAIRYGRLAHDAFACAGENRYIDYMVLSLGNMYYSMRDFAEAKKKYAESFYRGKDTNDMNLILRSLDGYALALKSENTEECLHVMTQIVEYIQDSIHWVPSPHVLANYAVCHAEHNNRMKAKILMNMAKESKITSAEDSLHVLFAEYHIHRMSGEYEIALDILENMFLSQDKNSREALNQSVLSAQRDYYEQSSIFHQYKTSVWRSVMIVCTILFILFIMLICYYTYVNLRQRDTVIRRTVSKMEELQRDYKNSLDHANEFSSRINALYSTRYNYMNAICEEYYSHPESARKRHVLQIVDEMVSKLSEDNEYETLRDIVNLYHNDIMDKLKMAFPTMKHDDLRLFCYLAANFSSISVSLFLGISVDNVYTRKNRLKAKISSLSNPLREELLAFLN